MPGRRCLICSHPQRRKLDALLVDDAMSNRALAAKLSVSESSVRRHKENHIAEALRVAGDRRVVENHAAALELSGSLESQVAQVKDRVAQLLAKAEATGDIRTALQGAREAMRALELDARFRGTLQNGNNAPGATVVIFNGSPPTPEWIAEHHQGNGAVLLIPDNGRDDMNDFEANQLVRPDKRYYPP